MNKKIDLKATMEVANQRYQEAFEIFKKENKDFTRASIARDMGKKWQTIHTWCQGGKIPSTSHEKLVELFISHGINPLYCK